MEKEFGIYFKGIKKEKIKNIFYFQVLRFHSRVIIINELGIYFKGIKKKFFFLFSGTLKWIGSYELVAQHYYPL